MRTLQLTSYPNSNHVWTFSGLFLKASLIWLISCLLASGILAQTTFISSGTYIVPPGVTEIKVECWGGGGAGGGVTNANHNSGGGGAGGAFETATLSVMPGQVINYIVGTGGMPVAGGNGTNGGTTVFLSVSAAGGQGGKVGTGNSGQGAGGVFTPGFYNGGAGAAGLTQSHGGAGGGSAGNGEDGNDATGSTGGMGGSGSIPGGDGADGPIVIGTGIAAVSLSGGGSGAFNGGGVNSTVRAGGAGFRGQITIYTCVLELTSTQVTSPICVGGSSSVTLNGTAARLPAGTYTVTYDVSAPNAASGLTATMTVVTAGTGTFSSPVLTNAGMTTITITNLDNGSCSSPQTNNNTATIDVATDPLTPTGTRSPIDGVVCAGQTLTLTNVTDLGGGTGNCNLEYRYNNGSGVTAWSTTPSSFAAVVGNNTIEIRKVCDGTACEASGISLYSWTVVADPATPTATKSPNVATVCAGQTLTLSGVTDHGGGTGPCLLEYRYNNGSGFTTWSATPASFTAVTGTNTIEIRKVCDGPDCNTSGISAYSWTVVADPAAPTGTKLPDLATVCVGQTLALTNVMDNGGGTGACNIEYRYDNGSGFTAWSSTPASFAAVTGNNILEIRKVCDGADCNVSGISTYTWTAAADAAAPTATKSLNLATVCAGQILTLTNVTDNGGGIGSCNIEYRYNDGLGFSAWSTTPASFAAVTGVNSIEIRKVCDGSSCNISPTSSYFWTVVADPLAPTATKSPDVASVCAGQTLSLTNVTDLGGGTGVCNIEYRFDTGMGFSGWSTTLPGFVAVTGTNTIELRKVCDGADCNTSGTSTYSWTVVADPAAPTATKSPNVSSVCRGTLLSLSGVTDNGGGTGACNLEYSHNGGPWTTTLTPFASVADTNKIAIRKNCNGSGCNLSPITTYFWLELPRPKGAISGNESICYGETATLTLSVTGSGTISGTLSDGTAFMGTAPTILVPVSPAMTTNYTIATLADNICSSIPADLIGSALVTVSGCTEITGKIIWEGNRQTLMSGVNGVTVTLSGDASDTDLTGLPGTYSLLPGLGSNFMVTPVKNRPMPHALNGLTAADASRIQMHVSGSLPLGDPYKIIAADVNKTNSVTSLDANLVQQAILGYPSAQQFFINTTWRFVPKAYVFPIPTSPWGFPEKITLVGVTGNVSGQDFIGVKTGDVNSSANPVNTPGLPVSELLWKVQDQELIEGAMLEASFRAENFNALLAMQLGIQFDPTKLQFLGLETPAGSLLKSDNFGLFDLASGEIRVMLAMAETKSMPAEGSAFKLRFKSLQSGGQLSDVLHLSDEVLPAEAYAGDLRPIPVKLAFESSLSGTHELASNNFRLLQNRPNPFKDITTIGFVLPEACEAQLRVFDVHGRLVLTQKGTFAAGYNEQQIQPGDSGNGVLYYELTTPFGVLSKKMASLGD